MIQPFDGARFDKRYDDVLAPAIRDANLEPYRVDRDPKVSIPIEEIQSQIESARMCLADITTDNPNVWFELGYAIASKREVVLICSDERKTKFPFDVQHRTIISYTTESLSDYHVVREKITGRLQALLEKECNLQSLSSMTSVAQTQGLEQYEVATLVSVAQEFADPTDGPSAYVIQQDMDKAGFNKIATTLGLRGLISKGMIESYTAYGYNEEFTAFRATEHGIQWLVSNANTLNLRRDVSTDAVDSFPF
ncbi:hypothetical protein SH501x_000136 [Pirellulaceae bacterium SH501]